MADIARIKAGEKTYPVKLDLQGDEGPVGEPDVEGAEVDVPAVLALVHLIQQGELRISDFGPDVWTTARTWKNFVTAGILVPLLVTLKSLNDVGFALVDKNASIVASVWCESIQTGRALN